MMQFEIHFGKAKGHSKAMVNFTKNLFYNLKRYLRNFFINKIFIWINPWPQDSLYKLFKDFWCTLYMLLWLKPCDKEQFECTYIQNNAFLNIFQQKATFPYFIVVGLIKRNYFLNFFAKKHMISLMCLEIL